MYDLLLKSGQVIDPSQNLQGMRDIAIKNGKIAAIEESIPEHQALEVISTAGLILTPGLIDLHTHIYEGVSVYGINADQYCLMNGVTTAVDAGSSGAQTFPGFRKYIVENSKARILAFLNISTIGMITKQVGELEDLRYADIPAALETIESNKDIIVGIKVRMEKLFHGENGWEVLELVHRVSDAAKIPVMYHIAHTYPPIDEVLCRARKGDIFTHCFHAKSPGGIIGTDGKLLPEALEAQERGVYFDVGHGKASFSFAIARQALEQGLLPYTISTDLHINNIHGPVYNMATTLSKFLFLGFSLKDVIAMATLNPARCLGFEHEIGTLKAGSTADITILELCSERIQYEDCGVGTALERVESDRQLVTRGVIRRGELVFLQN